MAIGTVADLQSLKELYAWMREERILYARSGELELRLETLPPPVVSVSESANPIDEQKEALKDLLWSGDDGVVDAILSMTGAA